MMGGSSRAPGGRHVEQMNRNSAGRSRPMDSVKCWLGYRPVRDRDDSKSHGQPEMQPYRIIVYAAFSNALLAPKDGRRFRVSNLPSSRGRNANHHSKAAAKISRGRSAHRIGACRRGRTLLVAPKAGADRLSARPGEPLGDGTRNDGLSVPRLQPADIRRRLRSHPHEKLVRARA